MMEWLNKNKRIFIIVIGMVLLSMLVVFLYHHYYTDDKILVNSDYYVTYDNSWNIEERSSKRLVLSHGRGKLTFNIKELESDKVYLDVNSLIDDIRYDIEKENKNYKLLYKEESKITLNQYNGYWLLYENGDSNVKVGVYKDGDRLVIITYEANIKYFDILLDSANNIIYNFVLTDRVYSLGDELELNKTKVTLNESNDFKDLDKTYTDEIANNNYLINYNLPVGYQSNSYNSLFGAYTYKAFGDYLKSSNISINIYLKNLYEYLKDDSYTSLYGSFKAYRENQDFKENLDIYDEEKEAYIYKNSYVTSSSFGNTSYENVLLIYPLDRNHILVVEFANRNTPVSEELLKSFKINYIKNYSSYIKNEIKDNKIVSYIKGKEKGNNPEYQVKIMVPTNFRELDNKNNIYQYRSYGMDYNYDIGDYKYLLNYEINISEESAVKQVDSLIDLRKNNGNYQKMKYEKTIDINGLSLKLYSGYMTNKSSSFYSKKYISEVKLLTYKLSNDTILSVKIQGNDKKIKEDLINEIVLFEINK